MRQKPGRTRELEGSKRRPLELSTLEKPVKENSTMSVLVLSRYLVIILLALTPWQATASA